MSVPKPMRPFQRPGVAEHWQHEKSGKKKMAPRTHDIRVKSHKTLPHQTTTYCCARAWRSRIAAFDNNSAASTSFAAAWAISTRSKPRR